MFCYSGNEYLCLSWNLTCTDVWLATECCTSFFCYSYCLAFLFGWLKFFVWFKLLVEFGKWLLLFSVFYWCVLLKRQIFDIGNEKGFKWSKRDMKDLYSWPQLSLRLGHSSYWCCYIANGFLCLSWYLICIHSLEVLGWLNKWLSFFLNILVKKTC